MPRRFVSAGRALEAAILGVLRRVPPETAHALSLRALALDRRRPRAIDPDPALVVRFPNSSLVWPNPVGLAAGFDKDARAVAALALHGFGSVECGTVTPLPQAGNPRPRVFRLARERAIVNRLGFPGQGLEAFTARLAALTERRGVPVGANIGANAASSDRMADYVRCAQRLAPLADYLTVNVSSPNTPGLVDLQKPDALSELVAGIAAVLPRRRPPVFLKLSPDLEDARLAEIVAVALESKIVSGIIVSNTTSARFKVPGRRKIPAGGLSGPPLFDRSTRTLRRVALEARGRLDLVGAGGVSSAETAYAKIRAGAHAVQLYTALAYRGPGLVEEIARGLKELLLRDGFQSVASAVGADIPHVADHISA